MKRFFAAIAACLLSAAALAAPPLFPLGTTNVAVTGTAATLTLSTATTSARIRSIDNLGLKQLVLTNVGTQTVFVTVDGTTATAANGMPLLPNSQVVVSVDFSQATVSAIASSTGSTLYATLGIGE